MFIKTRVQKIISTITAQCAALSVTYKNSMLYTLTPQRIENSTKEINKFTLLMLVLKILYTRFKKQCTHTRKKINI